MKASFDPAKSSAPGAGGRRVVAPVEHPRERAAEGSARRAMGFAGKSEPGCHAAWPSSIVGARRAPRVVDEALARPGQPLDRATRRDFEPRFGRDFSQVRVHHDELAGRSARSIGAQAYSSGSHIVFGRGRWQPGTSQGRQLLAHELAHTAQQDGSSGAASVWRKPLDISDFDSGSFSEQTLLGFLTKLRATRKIEDNRDSDDKARGVVRRWLAGGDAFVLEPLVKVLLVKEMQSGFTGDDDERAILNLLEKSARSDVEVMFGPGGLDPDDLDSDFHGAEEGALRAFYDRMFIGGRKAAMKGGARFSGESEKTLTAPYSHAAMRAVIDERMDRVEHRLRDVRPANREWWAYKLAREGAARIEPQVAALPAAQRDSAAQDLAGDRVQTHARSQAIDADIAKASTPVQAQILTRRQIRLKYETLLLDLVMQGSFRDIATAAPKQPEEFQKQTKLLSEAEKKAAGEAIEPKTRQEVAHEAEKGPVKPDEAAPPPPPPPKFKETLPGEQLTYGDKVKARIPKLIDAYHAAKAAKRSDVEHADPKLTRSLDDLQLIADKAKDEVDRVFGQFYDKDDKTKFPSFQADKRDASGALLQRGNLHDVWQEEEDRRKADPAGYEEKSARFWIYYLLQNDNPQNKISRGAPNTIESINAAHDARPSFGNDQAPNNDEARILRQVGDPFIASDHRRLYEIGRAWDAFKRGSDIFVQLFKDPNAEKDRLILWDMFATLIHEYLHKLAHEAYGKYAEKLGGEASTAGSTLLEGVDSLLSEIVWTSAMPRAKLLDVRKVVEPDAVAAGKPFNVDLLPAVPARADTYEGAVRLVSVVGIRNLYAAYFQGRVDLIGGS